MLPVRGLSALLACLALTGADLARASAPRRLPDCEERLSREPDGEAAASCLSELAWAPGPFQEPALRRLAELARTRPEIPWFGIRLGALKRSSPEEAERLYRRSIDSAVERRLARAEVYARANLSLLLQRAGRVKDSEVEVERASKVAAGSGDPKALARAAIARAYLAFYQGNLEQAYNDLADVRTEGDLSLESEYLFPLAMVTQQTGRFEEAARAYEQMVRLGETTGNILRISSGLSGLATTRKEVLSELPSAEGREEVLRLAHRALEAARATGRPDQEVYALWTIGSLSPDRAEARRHLERCLEVAASSQSRSSCQAVLARRLAESDPAAAEEAIQQALSLAREAETMVAWTSAWHERMRMIWSMAPPDRALADSLSALDAIEGLRDRQGGSVRQPDLFSTWAEDYFWLSGKLLELDRLEAAFGVIERMRARTLTDALGMPRPKVPPALHARRAEVALAITRLQRRLMEEDLTAADRETARSELDLLETEADRIRMQSYRSASSDGSRDAGFASLAQVRGSLRPDEAFLSFQVAPWKDLAGDFGGGSWLLVSTRAGTRLHRLADRTELRPNVSTFNGLFAARDGGEAEVSAVLYHKLLGEALAGLPPEIRKLVIVPDDALHRLPFAALRPEADGEPLAVRYQISLVPSATLWLRWRNEAAPASREPALVFAEPPASGAPSAERAAAFADRASLGPLPLSREEGESVVGHVGGGSRLLLGEAASEVRLKRDGAEGFRILHFATHSWTDDVEPERSYVYLAPGGPDHDDGLLQPREIAEMNLHGRLVVLSTCESAAGEILRGEGVMGLARSFFQSGAHPVVASLWKLRDDDGAALFDRFYAHLAEGLSVAAALQAAQRDLIADGAPAAAWAGVVVLGDGDRVPLPGGRKRPLPAAIGFVLLLLGVAVFLWRRRATAPAPPAAP